MLSISLALACYFELKGGLKRFCLSIRVKYHNIYKENRLKYVIEVFDMKLRHMHKKADLSLSINAIVILILAITMLGLGLMFIRNQFGGATNKLQGVLDQIDANEKVELEKSPDRVSLTTDTYKIKRGESKSVYFAIRNNLGTELKSFDIKLATTTIPKTGIMCTDAIAVAGKTVAEMDAAIAGAVSFQTFDKTPVAGGGSVVLPLTIAVASNALVTTYSCSVTLPYPTGTTGITAGDVYAKKDFFVIVTP